MTATYLRGRPGSVARVSAGAIAAIAMTAGALTACDSDADDTSGHSHAGNHSHVDDHHAVAASETDDQTTLRVAMRSLWAQHMEWTYATVVAFASDSPALEATMTRLLRNQAEIGDAVMPYYGTQAGAQLTDLLTTHIEEAVPVLTAAKSGDQAALTTAVEDWYANADEIGDFLASANPNWERADMRQMMKQHITQTIAYASDVIGGNYESGLDKYDEAEAHMTEMADMLTTGIIEQFPDKF
jgi:hypothetical protein